MTLVLLFISILVPVFLGAAAVSTFFKIKLPFLQFLPLSFFIGCGILTMILFLASIFGIAWSGLMVSLISIGSAGLFLTVIFKQKKVFPTMRKSFFKLTVVDWLLVFLILANILTIAYLAVNKPVVNWDAWANWSLRAKVFYFEKGVPLNPSHPYYLGRGGHINYPLHIPIFEAWIYSVLGQWDDQSVKIVFPLYTVLFALFVYALIRPAVDRTTALIFCLLFTLLPFAAYHSFSEYADLPTGLYLGLAVACAWLFMQTRQNGFIITSSLLLGMSAWVKNEGLILSGVALAVLFIYFRKHALKVLLPAVLFITPWLVFKKIFNLGISNLSPDAGGFVINFHEEAIGIFAAEIFRVENFGLLWIALLFILIFHRAEIKKLRLTIFLVLVATFILAYACIYVLTDNIQFVLNGIVVNRNLLTIAPTLYWIIALVFSRTLTKDKNTVK